MADLSTEYRIAKPEEFPAIAQMLELYQYELSDIWDQDLDSSGKYGYDLARHREGRHFHAHVALVNGHFAGFALVAPAAVTRTDGCWMEQFFVLKKHRRTGVGSAQAFWRRVIGQLTAGQYVELQVTQGGWLGVVQQFDMG